MAKHKAVFKNDIVTPKGRLSFPHLVKPDTEGQYADDKFKVTLLIPQETSLANLKNAVLACAKEAWPGKNYKLADLIHPFHNGDKKAEANPAYAKTIYITCKTKNRPAIVDTDRKEIDPAEAYAGCDARLVVTAMSYEQKGEPGVTFLLETVQKLGDNTRFGKARDLSVLDDGEVPASDGEDVVVTDDADGDEPSDDELFGRKRGKAKSEDDELAAMLGE